MFPRVQGLINRGHQVANKADYTLELVIALIEDLQKLADDLKDGWETDASIRLDDKAAHKLLSHFFKGQGGDLPFSLSLKFDPTWDKLPGKVAKFVGGPAEYDGNTYSITEGVTEITLEGGAEYKFNGHVFEYVGGP